MKTVQEAVNYAINHLFAPPEKLLNTDPTMAALGADSLDMHDKFHHVEDELEMEIRDEDVPMNLELRVSQYVELIDKLIPANKKVSA